MAIDAGSAWNAARAQWNANARLRLATLLSLGLVWLSLLFAWSDRIDARLAVAAELRSAIERSKPLGRDKSWPARDEESAKQLALMRGLLWREPDLGLAEAAMQDELRQLAARTGVVVRDMKVGRLSDRDASAVQAAASPVPAGAKVAEVRARMLVDFRRERVMALLSELSQSTRTMVVDRLLIRTAMQPPQAEIDVRIVVDAAQGAKS